ncbi:MAG: hypothetical protein QOH25_1863 [Acidobacteriota bacterium]|jgi:uncharacterized membrane protein|nr:hypothetical protein [Acidobacteriota bacterium]
MSKTLILLLGFDLLMLAVFMFVPVMRGEDAFFGVRVSPEVYRNEGRRLLHRYWLWLFLIFIQIEVIGLLVSFYKGRTEFAQIAPRFLFLPCVMLFYVIFYRQAKRLELVEEHQRFASSLKTRRLADYTNLALEIAIVILTIAPILVLVYYYPQLPERIPTHWNWKGEPDEWARKSYYAVFSLAAMLVYMQGLILIIKHGLLGVKMTLPAEHAEDYLRLKEAALALTVRFMDWMRLLLCIMLGSLATNIAFSAVEHLRFLSRVVTVAAWAAGLLMFAAIAFAIYRFYRIDRRLKSEVGRVYVQRQRDAAHWYLGGLIYFNREDPALWVEKLVGWGYTCNLGNKWVYAYITLMIGIPLLLVLPLES